MTAGLSEDTRRDCRTCGPLSGTPDELTEVLIGEIAIMLGLGIQKEWSSGKRDFWFKFGEGRLPGGHQSAG